MKKIILIFILLYFYIFVLPFSVLAVTKTAGNLEVAFDEPLFADSIIWYPGLEVSKLIIVKNLDSQNRMVSIQAVNTSQTGNMAEVLSFKVNNLYHKTLRQFWDDGQVNLSVVNGGGTAFNAYAVTIKMSDVGNAYQGQQAKFDLIVGFEGTDNRVSSNPSSPLNPLTIPPFFPEILGISEKPASESGTLSAVLATESGKTVSSPWRFLLLGGVLLAFLPFSFMLKLIKNARR